MKKAAAPSIVVAMILLALAVKAEAQQTGKIPRVGILFIGSRDQPHLEAFRQGLRERGYTEGKNIVLDYRYAEGKLDRLPSLAAELVQLKVDVIVTTSGNSAKAASEATKTIPIVLTTGADPVKSGFAVGITGFRLSNLANLDNFVSLLLLALHGASSKGFWLPEFYIT